ncbi:ATP-binding protein [Cryptosporangium aurantiacum]|uniref:Histidine kinase-like ATPase domain-containing protein n=1 Tax=Cryptosporangium aurantiacum TaxID=134849 RepID=A0A1M7JY42_9ACTN|nr:ATP-binding protein [Cryptosporangium aurantiacum]SHM57447.1 Histidine kinase-like ATPase domain-containing protein [Cryptosporangium aurantiacum]
MSTDCEPTVQLDVEHEPIPAATAQVRGRVRALLAQWRIGGTAAEDILLVVHEMVANVIDHARTPFRLAVQLCGSFVRVSVHDASRRPLVVRAFDPEATRGRGLPLIAAISERWGCSQQSDGKTVWAAIPV